MALPSMTWTRTENGTHGILRAAIDFSAGRPRPGVVSAYQVRTSDTLRYDDFQRDSLGNIFFYRIDVIFVKLNWI